MTIDGIKQIINTTPPTCVSNFQLRKTELPTFFDNNFKSVYNLSCKCGSQSAQIIGYLLRDYNKELDQEDNSLITPLGFKCSQCRKVTEILDSDVHGYHAEFGTISGFNASTKYRGEGPRIRHKCPKCDNDIFNNIIAGFVYWNLEEWENESMLAWQNFFSVFLFYASCINCHHISEPIQLGKL